MALLISPWSSSEQDAGSDDDGLDSRLRSQLSALSVAEDATSWGRGFGPGGAEIAAATWQSRQLLGIDDVQWSLVSLGAAPDAPDGTRSADLRLTWHGGGTETTTRLTARVQGSGDGQTVDIEGFEAGPDPLPVWLAGALARDEASGVVLIGETDPIPEIGQLVAAARARIDAVTGRSAEADVVVPPSQEIAAALLGRPPTALATIAGVATTLPGFVQPVVVLNPEQFDVMDPRGRQIVVTHELTHAVTGAVGATGPTWLIEGFADWVALHDDDASLRVAAGDLLHETARDGAPRALPSDADLTGARSAAAYQSAWLAVVVLAENFGGDTAVLQVYDAVIGGAELDEALARIGTSVAELTRRWQDYLTYSASIVS